ncbi:MAG TPA: hypothetical protein VN192_05845 [Flavobacterium sp.]|jgi:hypothetical protein|nr:hypothetical protein [Flavobacterium sp.]
MKKNKLIFLLVFFISIQTYSQVFTDKVVGEKNEVLKDSLKTTEYPYHLPIWGEKVAQKGYKLPYSAGVSVNYFWAEQDIVIDNLYVGFNNGPMYDLDEIIRFNNSVSEATSFSIRPDIWLLPFLNVYGVFAKIDSSTAIDAGLWVPDENNNWSQVLTFGSTAKFNGTTFGFGMTPTIGVGGGWLALDMNVAWTDLDALEDPAFSFVFGPRIGKTIKLKKPDSNINLWTGAFRLDLKSETVGSLALTDVVSGSDAQAKVDAGFAKVAEKQTSVDNWWNGLTPMEQANPINQAKYNTANSALDKASGFLTAVDGALSTAGSSTVQYSLDKAPKDMWNFLIGAQYQYNKHFMWRAEVGFLGSRTHFMTSLQYRFGL